MKTDFVTKRIEDQGDTLRRRVFASGSLADRLDAAQKLISHLDVEMSDVEDERDTLRNDLAAMAPLFVEIMT